MRRIALLILIPLLLGACANKGLRDLQKPSEGPDEFLLKPGKPLEDPLNFSDLPAPTPGKANLADRSALDDGLAAVGGNVNAANAPIPASDGALVQHASRLGVAPNIREELAEKDARFRKRAARLTQIRIVHVDRYNEAYRRETLDPAKEAVRWRNAGARTPSSPPAN
ncbi:MAG: DUF3035 domain-containing protein [Sulfitobacter sp.]